MAAKMEDKSKLLEEKLREGCCVGDEQKVKALLGKGVDVNAANRMNGWTPLHWASKRGNKKIVELLLKEGAVTTSKTKKGETAAALANNQDIKDMVGPTDGEPGEEVAVTEGLPIVPNYIKNPPFMYMDSDTVSDDGDTCMSENDENLPFGLGRSLREDASSPSKRTASKSPLMSSMTSPPHKTVALDGNSPLSNTSYGKTNGSMDNIINVLPELVLKVRVANSEEEDFIEIELDFDKLQYNILLEVCCRELGIERNSIRKVRKLPNTIVRKDKDVGRLQQCQELEIVQYSKEGANR